MVFIKNIDIKFIRKELIWVIERICSYGYSKNIRFITYFLVNRA